MLSLLIRQPGIHGRTLRFRVISTVTSSGLCRAACANDPNVKGERIWGRGSSDDKSGLVGILFVLIPVSVNFVAYYDRSAIELLVERKFVPTRTVVLAFGFDEETSGPQVG